MGRVVGCKVAGGHGGRAQPQPSPTLAGEQTVSRQDTSPAFPASDAEP